MTTRCNMMLAKRKSANPLSGLIPANCVRFSGFTCNRRHTANTKSIVNYLNLQNTKKASHKRNGMLLVYKYAIDGVVYNEWYFILFFYFARFAIHQLPMSQQKHHQ